MVEFQDEPADPAEYLPEPEPLSYVTCSDGPFGVRVHDPS